VIRPPMSYRPLDHSDAGMTYGLLLPHFGREASPDRIIDSAVRAEEIGMDAVWVRDHLLWSPHGMDGTDPTFVEPLTVLAAIASRTSRIFLGTAVLAPLRWPLKLAQDLASLSYLAKGRVVAGLGLGTGQKELGAVGFEHSKRKRIFVETTKILRRVWEDNDVSWDGEMFPFGNVSIHPKPAEPIPLWYGGTTLRSVENAVDFCDGWIPGRIPIDTLDERLRELNERSAQAGAKVTRAIVPLVKVDRSLESARSNIDVAAVVGSSEASRDWIAPASGGFDTVNDLAGVLVAGDPARCVEEIAELGSRGMDHFVFDLRLQHDHIEEVLELIASDVLPVLRRERI
jgi:alkanesulfonate monooxygenase SsuD/methylene tetrahydromethanopterin reductase-like flavin-dependent oxidoreductase (luciferase family)